MREKKPENKQKVFHSMKAIHEKTIEVNNDLKIKVDEQQDDIKHLKFKCNTHDEDKVQEITAARNRVAKSEFYEFCRIKKNLDFPPNLSSFTQKFYL